MTSPVPSSLKGGLRVPFFLRGSRIGTTVKLSAFRREPLVSPFCVKDAKRLGARAARGYLVKGKSVRGAPSFGGWLHD